MSVAFTIGRHHVHRIEEWQGRFAPPEMLFSGYEEAAFAREREAFTPDYVRDGMIYGFLQSWVIEADGRRILFDTGAGNDKDRPGLGVFSHLNTDFLAHLEAAGFSRESIDVVVCSHLHIDHVGWNTMLIDGRWAPTFPNARYLFPRVDRRMWDPAGADYATLRGAAVNAGVFEDSVQPILTLGRAELMDDGHEVAPGMTMRAAPGHTPGQMLLDVREGEDRALFTGDILHHPMQIIRPDWNSVYCEDADQARDTRRRVLHDALETRARLVPAHFGGVHSAFVTRGEDGLRPVFI